MFHSSVKALKAVSVKAPSVQQLSNLHRIIYPTHGSVNYQPLPVTAYDINNLNPSPILKVVEHPTDSNKQFTVVNDGLTCIGGSKQRLLDKLLPLYPQEEVVIAGTALGLAQVALAVTSKKYGKKASIFLEGSADKETTFTAMAQDIGANIYYSPSGQHTTISEAYSLAQQYTAAQPSSRLLMPIGLKSPPESVVFQCFKQALQEAFQGVLMVPPKRLWIVSGTGFLCNVLHSIWPNTEFLVVPADVKVWSKSDLDDKKHQIFYPKQEFPEKAPVQPPYPTVPWYDTKLWQFVLQHGEHGDHIWNVGRLP